MARRTLITGANRGLGLALAKLLIDGGDEVYATAREAQPDAVLALAPAGVVSLDLGDETSIVSAVAEVGHLTDGIDLLINCAGTDGRAYGMADDERHAFDFDAETFTDLMRINVTGPMVVIREALPLLRASADALILNFSS